MIDLTFLMSSSRSMESCFLCSILDGPHFLSHLNGTVNSTKSSNVSFECRAEGHPVPTLKWFKSNVPLSNVPVQTVPASKTKTIIHSVLKLDAVTKNQTAEYKCEVENIAGKKSQFISLNVLCKYFFE